MMNFATWNIRTLMDNDTATRPERRTAIVARELKSFNIDIAALSETRRPDEGQIKEERGGYTFFWKGKGTHEPRIHGVGFAIANELVPHLDELPSGINERLMSLRLKLTNNQRVTVISAYAPTLTCEDDEKEAFYCQLDTLLTRVPQADKIILLGDFNARVGRDPAPWPKVIGKEGVGKCNSNGTLLLTICSEHNLVITNTLFRQKDKFKTSWQHPRSKHWHLIDYIIVRARDQRDVLITKALTSADDCWTDHRLIRSVLTLHIQLQRRKQRKLLRPKMYTDRLKDHSTKANFHQLLGDRLPDKYPDSIEEHWATLKTVILSAGEESVGYCKIKHQDWFDENDQEIQTLLNKKRTAHQACQNNPNSLSKKQEYQEAKADVQRKTRVLKNRWWVEKSQEMQRLAETNNTRAFFSMTKAIYGPKTQGLNPLKSRDGCTLLKDSNAINERWREHFHELLNKDQEINEVSLSKIPQKPTITDLDKVPSLQEVENAIKQLKNNKAAGSDGIPAEFFKEGGRLLAEHTLMLIVKIWNTETIPSDLRDALIVTIFKKGDRTDCGNYRGITILSIAGKILARILSNRLVPLAEDCLPETQCGFRPNRSTTDMIFCARQMQEKCKEQHHHLYMAFIDLVKAFDSVNRDALWKILAKIGCPQKYINIVRLLHDDMNGMVLVNNNPGENFEISAGVKQGCVIAPTLFSIFVGTILHLVEGKLPKGIEIEYRTDGGLFNPNRLRAKTKVSTTSIIELQYADDNVVLAKTEEDLQAILNAFDEAYTSIGLSLNTQKTQILHQPKPNSISTRPIITVQGKALQSIEHFPYLGSHLSSNANVDAEIQHRLKCASMTFGRLRARVFDNHNISVQTKLYVYQATVIPSLTYGCESWTTYRRHIRCLERYHQRCLRRILRVKWQDRCTNISILNEANSTSIEAMIIKQQLRWSGHIVRMPEHRLPKQIMYSQLKDGQRKLGRPQKRYKDALKANMKKCQIKTDNWEDAALNRSVWRRNIWEGTQCFEQERRRTEIDKRNARKQRELQKRNNTALPVPNRTNVCQQCKKICGSRIGLYSHLRSHKN